MMDIILMFTGSVFGGTITGIITVATLKTDVKWLKDGHHNLSKRILHIERNRT